jgi:hypothetical protein
MAKDDLQVTLRKFENIESLVAKLIEDGTSCLNYYNRLSKVISLIIENSDGRLTAVQINQLLDFKENLFSQNKDIEGDIDKVVGKLCSLAGIELSKMQKGMQLLPNTTAFFSAFNRKKSATTHLSIGLTSSENRSTPTDPRL